MVCRSRSVLDITTSSPRRLRMRVVLRPIICTVPATLPTTTKSPTWNGLSTAMDSDANKSPDVLHRQGHHNAAHPQAGGMKAVMFTPQVRQDGQQHHAPQQVRSPTT